MKFAVLMILTATTAVAADSKLDLRERIQFSRNAKLEVTFEHCNLLKCTKLNAKPIGQTQLAKIGESPDVPPGVAQQMLTDAGPNSESQVSSFAVAGQMTGDSELKHAICSDSKLEDLVKTVKNAKQLVFPFKTEECTRMGAARTIKEEAELLRKRLERI